MMNLLRQCRFSALLFLEERVPELIQQSIKDALCFCSDICMLTEIREPRYPLRQICISFPGDTDDEPDPNLPLALEEACYAHARRLLENVLVAYDL